MTAVRCFIVPPLSLSLSLSHSAGDGISHFHPQWMFTRLPQHIILLSLFFLFFCPYLLSRSLSLIPSAAYLAVGSSYPHNGSNSLSKGNTWSLWCFICLYSTHLSSILTECLSFLVSASIFDLVFDHGQQACVVWCAKCNAVSWSHLKLTLKGSYHGKQYIKLLFNICYSQLKTPSAFHLEHLLKLSWTMSILM